jgi:hypothetical protein
LELTPGFQLDTDEPQTRPPKANDDEPSKRSISYEAKERVCSTEQPIGTGCHQDKWRREDMHQIEVL